MLRHDQTEFMHSWTEYKWYCVLLGVSHLEACDTICPSLVVWVWSPSQMCCLIFPLYNFFPPPFASSMVCGRNFKTMQISCSSSNFLLYNEKAQQQPLISGSQSQHHQVWHITSPVIWYTVKRHGAISVVFLLRMHVLSPIMRNIRHSAK